MMFADYIKTKDMNLLSLSKLTGIPYATLHNGIENPSSLKADNLSRLSAHLSLSMDEVFEMLHESTGKGDLLSLLLEQQNEKQGLYAYTQVDLAYHSGVLENSSLSYEDVEILFESGKVEGSFKASDIVFASGCLRAFVEMLPEADRQLTTRMIEKYALMLSYQSYKSYQLTKIKELLIRYNSLSKVTFSEILNLHVDIITITNSKTLARLLSFKECLRANITPFIVDSDYKAFYERGIEKYHTDSTFLSDVCLRMQENYDEIYDKHKKKQPMQAAL